MKYVLSYPTPLSGYSQIGENFVVRLIPWRVSTTETREYGQVGDGEILVRGRWVKGSNIVH